MIGRNEPRRITLRWHKTYRIVSAKHPPINVFEGIVGARQMEMAFYLEGLTNDRLRDESGEAPIVEPSERVTGSGASIVMAAFTHTGRPSRFSDGSYGVYYAAHALETAVRETAYHRTRFMAATQEPPCDIDMRAYVGRPLQPYLDLRTAIEANGGSYIGVSATKAGSASPPSARKLSASRNPAPPSRMSGMANASRPSTRSRKCCLI
jgi:hypothetical protein